jgi:hypothetical protein
VEKPIDGRPPNDVGKGGLSELVEATGWSVEDVVGGLGNAGDPSEGVDGYRNNLCLLAGVGVPHQLS